MMELGSNQIAQILPHRYPFALVDRILVLKAAGGRAASSA